MPLRRLREQSPLIHCISNCVTVQDCANILLAAGGSPIMAQGPKEVAEITARCQATVLNTGTPDDGKFAACRAAGAAANRAAHPVILDPVGIGASGYRLSQVEQLLREVHISILRCNFAEAQALLRIASTERGVDSRSSGHEDARKGCAIRLARQLDCTAYLSGTADIVTDGRRMATLRGGSQWMRRVTGAGCMLSVLLGGFAAVESDVLAAAVAGGAFWKACAAVAAQHAAGAGSFRTGLFDAASTLPPEVVPTYVQVEWEEIR